MAERTYKQFKKSTIRHSALSYAVSILTDKRNESSCIPRSYVRDVYDYYLLNEDEDENKNEAGLIDKQYILDWERMYDSCLGTKHPSDLVVCYLCGPEPSNDFDEMVSLGILPQNIWAFEENKGTYSVALSSYETGTYSQPRIIRQNIETFFQQTPKKFDIIYIDACGSVPSEQHALRCISSIFFNHRLSSPGVVISNFAEPENKSPYEGLIAQYLFSKTTNKYEFNGANNAIISPPFLQLKEEIHNDFGKYYGEFISLLLRDIPGVVTPISRFWKNPYLSQLIDKNHIPAQEFETWLCTNKKMGSLQRFLVSLAILEQNGFQDEKAKTLLSEIDINNNLIEAITQCQLLKDGEMQTPSKIHDIQQFFENSQNVFQFLDRPHRNLFFDLIINQMSYPFHCCTNGVRRFQYKAKNTTMFTDITPFDECRYIYEWVPGLHQITSAFQNKSWQYTFRFALDGLIKTRQNLNNEFFYQGSVVPNQNEKFRVGKMSEREIL